jgi:hypothetical protein
MDDNGLYTCLRIQGVCARGFSYSDRQYGRYADGRRRVLSDFGHRHIPAIPVDGKTIEISWVGLNLRQQNIAFLQGRQIFLS